MEPTDRTQGLLPLLREFGMLERKRVGTGVTPLEYQRWLELRDRMRAEFPEGRRPQGDDRRTSKRVPTRMIAEFQNPEHLKQAVVRNISRGGLFLNTPFAAELGTQLVLKVKISETGDLAEIPCEVVSANVDADLSHSKVGMGLKFKSLSPAQKGDLKKLFEKAMLDELEHLWAD